MAIGMAVYNSKTDKEYMDVFRRADSAMYEDKKQKKLKI
jgi:GGDEF domain-containing protein